MNKSLCFVVALLFLAATEAVLPNGDCYVNDLTCEIDDNFIGIVDNIMSAEDCKQECKNNTGGGDARCTRTTGQLESHSETHASYLENALY